MSGLHPEAAGELQLLKGSASDPKRPLASLAYMVRIRDFL